MSVAAVGGYFAPNAYAAPAPYAPYGAPAAAPFGADQYRPAAAPVQAQAGGLTWPRMLAWAGGGLAAWKLILPHLGEPGGLITAAVIGAGAYLGEKGYQMVKGNVASGDIGRYASWGGGAFAAFKLGRPMMGSSPSGWLIGGLVIGGAWLGNKLYDMVTGKV